MMPRYEREALERQVRDQERAAKILIEERVTEMKATNSILEPQPEGGTAVRRRRTKVVSIERKELLWRKILSLRNDLESAGFGSLLRIPAPVQFFGKPIYDPKTGGSIAHVEEELGTYIQRVGVVDNYFQRQPYDHLEDTIYRRLIRDFIDAASIPESKVAALGEKEEVCVNLNEQTVRYSIIDGLQRLYCFYIALLLVWEREKLLADQCITQQAWDYMKDTLAKYPDPTAATEQLLKQTIRYEIFWNITREGLLHYMVTFNSGQRSMDVKTQLEIMRQPLLSALGNHAGIAIYKDSDNIQGNRKPKDQFAASDLILAARAFVEYNPQLRKPDEAETLLESGVTFDGNYDVGPVGDVMSVLKTICVQINQKLMNRYSNDPANRYILSSGGLFLVSLAAACGKVRNNVNMTAVTAVLEKMLAELDKPGDDPLGLGEYQKALAGIKSSRGRSSRRLIYDTFLRFFNGATPYLDWKDTARKLDI